jgi:hypothetical protein
MAIVAANVASFLAGAPINVVNAHCLTPENGQR